MELGLVLARDARAVEAARNQAAQIQKRRLKTKIQTKRNDASSSHLVTTNANTKTLNPKHSVNNKHRCALRVHISTPNFSTNAVNTMSDDQLNWTEFQAAYHVGRLGTVSAAADYLGVHRSTVQRHIDLLERRLGSKLFHRHSKGYSPTELGHTLMTASSATEDRFSQIAGIARNSDENITGDFVVTSIDVVTPFLSPLLTEFTTRYPGIRINFVSSHEMLRMELGEAHIALRLGSEPTEPDYVVQLLTELEFGLYASADYVDRLGKPETPEDLKHHKFLEFIGLFPGHPWKVWLDQHIAESNVIMRSMSTNALDQALIAGLGIGMFPTHKVVSHPEIVPILDGEQKWSDSLWAVTHVDIHRTPKV